MTRDGQISVAWPFSFRFVLLFFFSFFFWHPDRTPPSRLHPDFSFHLSFIRSGLVWVGFAGGFGWLETSTNSLSFVGTTFPFQWASRSSMAVDVLWALSLGTSSSSRFFRLPYPWGSSFKTLLFEEPQHPNLMASLAIVNPIRLLSGLLGWDQGSKPSAVPDIACCGCSCNLLDFGQVLCCLVLLLLCCLLLLLLL
jgi:hypothetical protein